MEENGPLRERLEKLEARLAVLERWHDAVTRPVSAAERAQVTQTTPAASAPAAAWTPRPAPPPRSTTKSVEADGAAAARWMAGGAAVAFLLAAVYLLRVVYDSGWLTPAREIGLAVSGGVVLIVAGLWIARFDKAYAAWLPAAGSVVLYVAAYGAHLYYPLIERPGAIAAVAATSLLTLWLGNYFRHSVFVLFAVLGSYLFPLFLPLQTTPIGDLAVYFAAWGLVFAGAALLSERRLVYILAMYCSLLGFQWVWTTSGQTVDWLEAVLFQLFQFTLFAATAVTFSIMHRRGLDALEAIAHGVALFCFYAFEYALLREYAAAAAGPVALGSAVFVLAAYVAARRALPPENRGHGATLVSAYCALVTAHIVFFEWVPNELQPWAALLAPVLTLGLYPLFRDTPRALLPLRLVSGALFLIGFLAAMDNAPGSRMPLPDLVLFAYAAMLYLGYLLWRRGDEEPQTGTVLLFAAHLAAMLALARVLDSGFAISVSWALLALAALAIAVTSRDRNLGRSSLLIFAASGLKVLLVDLQGSDSLLRVFTLLVLGVSLYAGGWLYQRVFTQEKS